MNRQRELRRTEPPRVRVPAFIQSPQFYAVDPVGGDPLQIVAHLDQRLFYIQIQPSKSLEDGCFSCGSNVDYLLSAKRGTSMVVFNDPSNPKKAEEPGGWSYEYDAAEVFVRDINGYPRPQLGYQPTDSPTEDHCKSLDEAIHTEVIPREVFPDIFGSLLRTLHKQGRRRDAEYAEQVGRIVMEFKGLFHDDVLGKGEAPKDAGNLSGKQHPKWAGGTIGDFFYRYVPGVLRWIPAMPQAARFAVRTTFRLHLDSLGHLAPVRQFWDLSVPRYTKYLALAVGDPTKNKINPMSKVGREFFRSGSWYFRGTRDLIFIAAPVLLLTSAIASTIIGQIITGAFAPMMLHPLIFIPFLTLSIGTSIGLYLYSTKRHGQSIWEVMTKKEAVMLGLGWPGYFHANFWGLRGPSGRLGATTTKGIGKKELVPMKYAAPTAIAGALSLAAAVQGTYMTVATGTYWGWSEVVTGEGLGVMFCSFWALYHALLIGRGFQVGQGMRETANFFYEGLIRTPLRNLRRWISGGTP